ncbi:hypothetical protein H4218_001001 [Coemansia sp. IMI 209128]|nr:hypothetical protein H4218_001001 [Coemansia sp. IMI 209128]
MLPHSGSANHTPPPAPPGSAASESFTYTPNPASSALDGLFAQGPLDIDVLSELLGSLDSTSASSSLSHYSAFAGDATKSLPVDDGDDADEEIDIDLESTDLPDYSGITTESVLFGLQSLDDFERQAAIHTEGRAIPDDGAEDSEGPTRASAMEISSGYDCLSGLDLLQDLSDHTPSGSNIGLGSFNEAELSAALEQIYWSSLEMPLPVSSDVATQDSAGMSETISTMAAPTPTSTPVSHAMPAYSKPANVQFSSWASASDSFGQGGVVGTEQIHEFADGAHVQVEGSDDDDDDDNPLELEELSLFSLFLSDMAAFESFLGNLSLNQLRQCAATVNSVLVRRETTLSDTVRSAQSSATRRQRGAGSSSNAPFGSLTSTDVLMSSGGGNGETERPAQSEDHSRAGPVERCAISAESEHEQSGACLPSTTLTLLREWLPPSTADCVITALQAANLAVPLASNLHSQQADTAGFRDSMSTSTAASSSRPRVSAPTPSTDSHAVAAPSEIASRRVSASHYYSESTHTNEPLLETGEDDVPWLSFVYAQKGKPKRHRIRIDIERAPLPAIPPSFQANNCVYPRANCAKAVYTGNRWAYETECNGIGWKLAFLNQELLSGRRGLLQTAVNNYRTIVAGRKSRRIARLEKAERTHHASPACEPRATTAVRLAYATSNSGSGSKRSLPQPASTASDVHAECGAQTETEAEAKASVRPSGKRAKLTHCPSDDATSHKSVAPERPVSLARSATSGGTMLSPTAIGSDEPSSQPAARVSEGASNSGSLASAAHAPAAVTARVAGPPQPTSAVASQHAKCLTINAYVNSKFSRIRINIDLGTMDSTAADVRFKKEHAVFPRALNTSRSRYGALQGRWEFELTCNELAWKLAWLNKSRLRGRKPLIQKCLDAYRIRFSTPPWSLLSCYTDDMNESVDSRFFDYWTPRPGRLRLSAELAAATQSRGTLVSDPASPLLQLSLSSDHVDRFAGAVLPLRSDAPGSCVSTKSLPNTLRGPTTSENKSAEQPGTSRPTAARDDSAERQLGLAARACPNSRGAGGDTAESSKCSPSSSGSDSAARMRVIRPKSGSGQVVATAQATLAENGPVNSPSLPAAHVAGSARPIARPPPTSSALKPASVPRTKLPDCQHSAASSRSVVIPGKAVVVGSAHLQLRPRPPPSHVQTSTSKHSGLPGASIGNRPALQLPALAHRPLSPSSRGVRPIAGLGTSHSASLPSPAHSQHLRPSQRPPVKGVAASSRPAPTKAVLGAKSPMPSHVSANAQQRQRHSPPTASVRDHPPRPAATSAANPPVARRRHTDAPGETPGGLATASLSRSALPRAPLSASHSPAATEGAGAGTSASRSSLVTPIQATAKASVQSVKGTEKSVKAQAAADMLTDVLRRLAKTDPSLAPLAGVLGKSHPGIPSKTWSAPQESNVNVDEGDDEDAPLDAKVAELEKLIIDLQNN